MKITSKILSIPPYLSTTWKNISSLHVQADGNLIVFLQNRVRIEVPGLSKETIDEIFEAHARSAEEEKALKSLLDGGPLSFSLPMKLDGSFDPLGSTLQHNPEQANFPPIQPEILKKIATIAKAFGLDDDSYLSKAEPHCNCTYCQLARALHGSEEVIEEVNEEDLKFRDWGIEQEGDQLYKVTNPLDSNECYNVFLGDPLGCTCGSKNCEHIRAVLNS